MTIFSVFTGPGRCRLKALTDDYVVVCSRGGIGDALVGLTATHGLQLRRPECKVVYAVSDSGQAEWVMLFHGYDYLTVDVPDGIAPIMVHDADAYNRQLVELTCRGRAHYYAAACGSDVTPVLPQIRPVREEERNWAERYRGAVVLAPWASQKTRTWPLPHWVLLERLLRENGRHVVIVDDSRARNYLFQSEILADESAARITALIGQAALVIGNDSGMAWVAGLQHTPAIALCSQVDGRKVFSICPSVTVINAPLACMDCHRIGPTYRPICESICANLTAIMPHDVASYAMAILQRRLASMAS